MHSNGFTLSEVLITLGIIGVIAAMTMPSCTTGTTSFDLDEPCTVSDGSMGDVFPVIFHDSVVEPATNAARAAFLK